MNWIPLLMLIVPLFACGLIAAGMPSKRTALGAAGLNCILSLILLLNFPLGAEGFHFQTSFPCVYHQNPEIGTSPFSVNLHLGLDGINLILVLLTTFISFSAVGVASESIKRSREFFICLLLISLGALGAFLSLDLFFLYLFHEVALIPTFIMIGVWGSSYRQYNAMQMTLYLGLGSLILLAGLIGFPYHLPYEIRSFDLVQLHAWQNRAIPGVPFQTLLSKDQQGWVFLLLLTGFGTLVSLWPFHSWAPSGYNAAPPSVAMLHAGVLKKFGIYGLLRLAVPFLPYGFDQYAWLLLFLLLGNILYIGFVTLAQKEIGFLLGFSSVMHMGYLFLGLATLAPLAGIYDSSLTPGLPFHVFDDWMRHFWHTPQISSVQTGWLSGSGIVLLMLGHGLSVALLFGIAGELKKRLGTLYVPDLGGLASKMPTISFFFMIGAFAAIGLPGLANFAGEVLIFFGAWQRVPSITILALGGVVLSAIYILRTIQHTFFGESNKSLDHVVDLQTWTEKWPYVLLILPLVFIGFYPQFVIERIQPALDFLFRSTL